MGAPVRAEGGRSASGLLFQGCAMAGVGLAVGLACWPLNAIDRLQDALIGRFPAYGGSWTVPALLLALAPIATVPLLLVLQAGVLHRSAGSGLPQLLEALQRPERRDLQLAAGTTAGRLALWGAASLALLPIGREGPAAQLGAAVAHGLGRGRLSSELLAAAAGAGLAGAFNTPLMGVIFVAEELSRRFQPNLIWPSLLMAGVAAEVAGLGGQPLFALGIQATPWAEVFQAFWALPVGLGAGLLGALMAKLLVFGTALILPRARAHPLATGLAVGTALTALTLISGGQSCGDGETLLRQTLSLSGLEGSGAVTLGWTGAARWGALVVMRLIGPVLALAAGIPGGVIDPAFAVGGSFGGGLLELLGGPSGLGVLLGMAAGLAGATQLPVMSLAFAIRITGSQQLLPGLLLAALLGAVVGRWLMPLPLYRALEKLASDQQIHTSKQQWNADVLERQV
ncbi:chloride channel protein [Vulcanococcus limneticus]|uniref:chloride channel protein n=1 Tax=Vulcanococcus limneticus TaxID=2170428 RepID=UPI00398BF832